MSHAFASFFIMRYLNAEWSVKTVVFAACMDETFSTRILRPRILSQSQCSFAERHSMSYSDSRSHVADDRYAVLG